MSPEKTLLALVDGNNFFCSCERVFDPKLLHVPLLVLSNNDGCVISRSQEVKKLGIPMGAPFFKIRNEVLKHNIQIRSSNFVLYNDMSRRLMQTLKRSALHNEVYSIDESFLSIPRSQNELELLRWARDLRATVLHETGLPVSIGLAPTKVLAKLCNRIAKKNPRTEGVYLWKKSFETETLLQQLDCEEVWGIGHQQSLFLKNNGIQTIADFIHTERAWIRRHLSVTGERLWMELQEIPTIGLNENPEPQKSIICSRSFGKKISSLTEIQEAVSHHLSAATEKLRFQKSRAGSLHLFLQPHREREAKAHPTLHTSHCLSPASDYTPEFVQIGFRLLESIFDPLLKYRKTGIALTDLQPINRQQLHWFESSCIQERKDQLMKTIDQINRRRGSQKIIFASSGLSQTWAGKSSQRSPHYTTSWKELPQVQ